jgi:AraC family ethanolamine operon transcriptional activator
MPDAQPSPILLDRSFDDFDELAVAVKHWDLDLRQLDRGRFEGELLQVVAGRILFTEARFGRTLDQKGAAPPGVRTIALPAEQDVRFKWRNKTITGNEVFIFPQNGELESISRPDFHVFIVSLPESVLQEVVDADGGCELAELFERETISCAPSKMARLREHLRNLATSVRRDDSFLTDKNALRELEYQIPRLFVGAIHGSRSSPNHANCRRRDLAIEQAKDFISQNSDEALTVQDVCRAAEVSERTLQYAFLENCGITPKTYMQAVRLNGVRRELKRAEPGTTINQVAMRWGFWHMSQFAVDYRKHFGELPSQTLQQVVRSL